MFSRDAQRSVPEHVPRRGAAGLKREPVESSGLVSVGYDEASETLEVEFPSGTIYQYYEVPKELYDELMAASSKGRFFNGELRNSFPSDRVG